MRNFPAGFCGLPYIAVNNVSGFGGSLPSVPLKQLMLVFLMKVFATEMKENFSVILIHVSLMAKDVIYFPSIPIGYLHFKIV